MAPDNLFRRPADDWLVLTNVMGVIGVTAAAFLLSFVASILAFWAVGAESLEALQSDPLLYTAVNGVGFVGFIVAAVGYVALRREWSLIHVRSTRLWDVGYVLAGLILLAVVSVLMGMVVSAIGFLLEELFGVSIEFGQNTVILFGRENPELFLYMIPVALFLVGPGEELVFRGVVQGLLRRVVGVVPAVLAASLVFGLGHFFAIGTGDAWTYIIVAGGMGVVLGGLYEYTENILVPIVVHGLWNAFLFAINWYVATHPVPGVP